MARVYSDRIRVAIDIGTTKICVLVAHHVHGKAVEVLGIGKSPSYGLKKGVVVDIAKTVQSIKEAVKEAELMSGMPIESAAIGVSGGHIHSINSQGVVPIEKGIVRERDIANAMASARAVKLAEGQQILHVLPQFFTIDGQERVSDPLGMHGIRLEVQAHIIIGSISSVQNLITCCERAGIKVSDVVLEQLASADAVLSDDERELGVGVLDIGGGTADFAVFQQGGIRHTMVLPVAGNHFTNDVAVCLRTTLAEAERIKCEFGVVMASKLFENRLIPINVVHGGEQNVVTSREIMHIVEPRAREMIMIIAREIDTFHLRSVMPTGLVLTGGGSLLAGFTDLASEILEMPVRLGSPQGAYDLPESLKSPIFATGYGLLVHLLAGEKGANIVEMNGPLVQRIVMRMKSWVSDFM